MKSLGLVSTTFAVAVAGCSPQVMGSHPSPATPTVYAAATDTAAVAPPVVQVRGFRRSSVVSVVAWDANNAAFGLRTSVTRTGELVGGRQFGDHRLYMTPFYAHDMGGFKYAAVTRGHLLLSTGPQRDLYSCFYGNDCSPMMTVGVQVPDALLRAHRDSLVVTFFPTVREPWTITLRRDLIAAYLKKVDSVVAEMRKPGTT
jgi:hypothetical protein